MLPLCSGILAKAIKIQSISLASLLKSLHFRSSRPGLFCKQGVLKNFVKLTGVSSGAGVSCKFCDILKNTYFCRTPQVAAVTFFIKT